MAKAGRNDPCPCDASRRAELQRMKEQAIAELLGNAQDHTEEEDELTRASNAAVDLVHASKLEEAEAAARDLIERYPEVHDGWDRL